MKTYCGYSLEVPQQGASREYPQHMFYWRNKNFFFALKIICLTILKENFYLLQIFIVTPENAWVTKEAAGGADDVRTAVQV